MNFILAFQLSVKMVSPIYLSLPRGNMQLQLRCVPHDAVRCVDGWLHNRLYSCVGYMYPRYPASILVYDATGSERAWVQTMFLSVRQH